MESYWLVIPAKAGIQRLSRAAEALDSSFRWNDGIEARLQLFDRGVVVGVDADVAGDLQRALDDAARVQLAVLHQRQRGGLRVGAAGTDRDQAVLGFQHVAVPEISSEASLSATASIASSRPRRRSVRHSLAISTAARVRLLPCLSSFCSNSSNRVNASAVAPAKPASTFWSLPRRRILRALAFITVLPKVTWPSPPITTLPLRRTLMMVVAWKDSMEAPQMGMPQRWGRGRPASTSPAASVRECPGRAWHRLRHPHGDEVTFVSSRSPGRGACWIGANPVMEGAVSSQTMSDPASAPRAPSPLAAPWLHGAGATILIAMGFFWLGWGYGYVPKLWPIASTQAGLGFGLGWMVVYAATIVLLVTAIRAWRKAHARLRIAALSGAELWRRNSQSFRRITMFEGIGCGLVVVLALTLRLPDLMAAGISLVVGLHFLPLGRLFRM